MADFLAVASLAGRVCLGLIFLTAALQKMRHWRVLEGVVRNYRILPEPLVKPTAWSLPPVEFVLGLALLAGYLPALSALAAILLLLVFAAAIAVNIRRGRADIDCGCHQSFLRQRLSPLLIVRNLGLVALLAPSFAGVTPVALPGLATGLAAGFAFFLFYLAANTIAALPDPGRPASRLGASS